MDPELRTLLDSMQRRSDEGLAAVREEMRALRSDVRGEMSTFRDELRGEMSAFRGEMLGQMSGFRDELRGEMGRFQDEMLGRTSGFRDELRGEMSGFRAEVRSEIADLRSEIHRLDVKVDETAVATRRHFDVMAEALRQEIRTVAEGVASNAGQLDRATAEIRAEMAAGFTVVGAAFIQVRRDLDDLRAGS